MNEAAAIAGFVAVTPMVATGAPSSVKTTVPVGATALEPDGFTVAVTFSVVPTPGVVVAGVMVIVVLSLATVRVTGAEVELA